MHKFLTMILGIFLFHSCSSLPAMRKPASNPKSILEAPMEEAAAFKGWKVNPSEQHGEINFSDLQRAEVRCHSNELTPTHPGMDFKEYYNAKYGRYKDHDVSPESSLCLIRSRTKKPYCLRSDTFYYVVVTDLYQDKCGNYYRGYTEVMFQKTHENMGTLFSPGRTMYQNPKSEFEGDLVVGNTYPVGADTFYFLTFASEKEVEKILKAKDFYEKNGFRFDRGKNAYPAK